MENSEEIFFLPLTVSEIRFLLASGSGLLLNIPEKALPTYTFFSKKEILDFSEKIRAFMDEHGIDL